MKNAKLTAAIKAKNDEFYTQYKDIENELKHYKESLEGKVIYMNADTTDSNFWKYFKDNFKELKLKKIICTYFNLYGYSTKTEYDGIKEKHKTLISGGHFNSLECTETLKEADIVVTNPPFSLWRMFFDLLIEYNKKFIILGNNNAITYKKVFPHFKEGKVWLGVSNNKTMEFEVPMHYPQGVVRDGKKYGKVPAISWITNIKHDQPNPFLELTKSVKDTEYVKYDNYDAIEVSRTKDIPKDYYEEMGVPLSFFSRHNPNQFEIIGELNHGKDNKYDFVAPMVNGKLKFARIVIKRKTT